MIRSFLSYTATVVVALAFILIWFRALAGPAQAAPSPSVEERQTRALESIARSLQEQARCRR